MALEGINGVLITSTAADAVTQVSFLIVAYSTLTQASWSIITGPLHATTVKRFATFLHCALFQYAT